MITNLFSRFDPISRLSSLPLNWLSSITVLTLIPLTYWLIPSRGSLAWTKITFTLHKEFKIILGSANRKGTVFFVSLFCTIILNNTIGLIPYVFTRTRHIVITLTFSLPLWLSLIIFGWTNHTKHIFAHLVPTGTPIVLTPLIILIETVRNLIRPGTLAIRLAANMIAGHLLLVLIGNAGTSLSPESLVGLIILQVLLLTLEFTVAVIQAYVFSTLRALYTREVN